MKFTKAFKGVANGDVYATEFKKGQNCPPELEAAAVDAGAGGGKPTKKDEVENDAEEENADDLEAEPAAADASADTAAA